MTRTGGGRVRSQAEPPEAFTIVEGKVVAIDMLADREQISRLDLFV